MRYPDKIKIRIIELWRQKASRSTNSRIRRLTAADVGDVMAIWVACLEQALKEESYDAEQRLVELRRKLSVVDMDAAVTLYQESQYGLQ